MITPTPDGVVIDVQVAPRASRSGLAGVRGGALLVRLHAPPVEGAVNADLVNLLAALLGVPRRAVTIVTGGRNRLKRVRVEGVSAELVHAKLEAVA